MTVPFAIHAADDRARGLVCDSWLKSFKSSPWAGPIPMDMYFPVYQAVIDRLLTRPHVRLEVATAERDDDQILGWCCSEPPGHHFHHKLVCGAPVLLYIYVKELYRRMGVAGALLERAGIDPRRKFCYPFPPCKPGSEVLLQHWTGGHRDVMTYRFLDDDIPRRST